MSSACNLIVASLLNFEGNPDEIYNLPFNLFLSNLNKLEQSNGLLSKMEVVCMMLTGYSLISLKPNEKNNLEIILQRILSAIELFLLYYIFNNNLKSIKNCLINPNFVIPCLKLFVDGIKLWKSLIGKINDFLKKLIFIYFNYCEIENLAEVNGAIHSSKIAILNMLKEFEKQDVWTRKRMKKMIIL